MTSVFELREFFTMPMPADPGGYLDSIIDIGLISERAREEPKFKKTSVNKRTSIISGDTTAFMNEALNALESKSGFKKTIVSSPDYFDIFYYSKQREFITSYPAKTKAAFIKETIALIESWEIDKETDSIYGLALKFKDYVINIASGAIPEGSQTMYSTRFVYAADHIERRELLRTITDIQLGELCTVIFTEEYREIFDSTNHPDLIKKIIADVFYNTTFFYVDAEGGIYFTNGMISGLQYFQFSNELFYNSDYLNTITNAFSEVLYRSFKSKPMAEIEEFISSTNLSLQESRSFDNAYDPFIEITNRGFEKVVTNLKAFVESMEGKEAAVNVPPALPVATITATHIVNDSPLFSALLTERGRHILPQLQKRFKGKGPTELMYLLNALVHFECMEKGNFTWGQEMTDALYQAFKTRFTRQALSGAVGNFNPLRKDKRKYHKVKEEISHMVSPDNAPVD